MTPIRFAFINTNNAYLFARTGFATDISGDTRFNVSDTDRLSIGIEGKAVYICGGDEVRILIEPGDKASIRNLVDDIGRIVYDKDKSPDAIDYMLPIAVRGFAILDALRAEF